MLAQGRHHPLLDAWKEGRSRLDLKRERDLPGKTIEDLRERRDTLTGKTLAEPAAGIQALELFQAARIDRPPAIRGPIQRMIMNDDQFAIAADVEVQLDGVGSQLDRLFKGRHRVLRRKRRGPSMRDIQCHAEGTHPPPADHQAPGQPDGLTLLDSLHTITNSQEASQPHPRETSARSKLSRATLLSSELLKIRTPKD